MTSCDKYDDAWFPFFKLFQIMWPDCPFPLYLNTEAKDFAFDGLDITCLHPASLTDAKGNAISWSNRLKQAVEKIEAEYIVFLLEDFFLKSPVRSEMIEDCLSWMDQDPSVVFIDFYHAPHEQEIANKEFSPTKRDYDWAINANAALWRKDFLLSILRDENPWDFEFLATARWRKTKYKVYTHLDGFAPVFDYLYQTDLASWSAIYKGQWIKDVPALFAAHGIEMDFEKRGFIDPGIMKARDREKNWLWHDVVKAVKSPQALWHYVICTKNVLKDKLRRFKAKWLNW